MERPPAPPEAALIRLARQAANIRMAQAAKEAGVSLARWSHIENGYETRQGATRQVQAKAGTLARMAHAVGITPERLETEGERPDAAEVLREILRSEPPSLRALPPSHDSSNADDASPESVAESLLAGYVAQYPDDRILGLLARRPGAAAVTRLAEVLEWIEVNSGATERNGTVG